MYQDSVSEAIAHFIGLFETHAEAARLRFEYDEFSAAQKAPANDSLPELHVKAPHHVLELAPNNPLIEYTPLPSEAHVIAATPPADIKLMSVPMPGTQWSPHQSLLLEASGADVEAQPVPLLGPIPGSVGMIVAQHAALTDNDVVVVGNYGGTLQPYQPDTSAGCHAG
jgi:hypothetical protein